MTASVSASTAIPRPTAKERWRKWRWPLAVALIVTISIGLVSWLSPSGAHQPLGADNPRPSGAQAVARILEGQGVQIVQTRRTMQVRAVGPESTVLMVWDDRLSEDAVAQLTSTEATVVIIGPSSEALDRLGLDVRPGFDGLDMRTVAREESCGHSAAVAAESVHTSAEGFRRNGNDTSIDLCFTQSGASFMAVSEDGRVMALANGDPLTNAYLAHEGNAALALHALGQHRLLLWYTPSPADLVGEETSAPTMFDMLPPGSQAVGWALIAATALLIVWRARRFGPIMTEPLPVSVPAAETLRGRGRLYRLSRDLPHAATSLRAGAVLSCASRIGLSVHASRQETVSAVSRAIGWESATVDHVLYGPFPQNESELMSLSQTLAQMEREVHENVH